MLNKNFLLDIFFPKSCFSCQREGGYLCQDCQAMLEISGFHQKYQTQNLSDLYYPLSYQNKFIQNLLRQFKYEPFVKGLAPNLACLIIEHFQLLNQQPDFAGFVLAPVPLEKKRLKWRGYNQAEEIGRYLAEFFQIPLINNALKKTKKTLPQMGLAKEKREENVKSTFSARDKKIIENKKILLLDDVYTTGATMEECAKVLKEAGAKKIVGIVVARG